MGTQETFPLLMVSVVVFRPSREVLAKTIATLGESARHAGLQKVPVVIVDNTPEGTSWLPEEVRQWEGVLVPELISGHGNVGFGRGHNRAATSGAARFLLVLNPDVVIERDALSNALAFMEANPGCGLLVPNVRGGRGEWQNLCKRYPSVLTLFLRGFAPGGLRKRFSRVLDSYEMCDADPETVLWDPPLVSGCFMFFRYGVWRQLSGFDQRFFLYFEDFDLSLRAARVTRIARVPDVRIIHFGGEAASKGLRHIALFCRAAWTFFSIHGWRWC